MSENVFSMRTDAERMSGKSDLYINRITSIVNEYKRVLEQNRKNSIIFDKLGEISNKKITRISIDIHYEIYDSQPGKYTFFIERENAKNGILKLAKREVKSCLEDTLKTSIRIIKRLERMTRVVSKSLPEDEGTGQQGA